MAAKAKSKTARATKVSAAASSKNSAVKTATSKTKSKTPNLKDLQSSLKNLEARLKRIDARARDHIKSFESQLADVQAQSKKSTSAQKAALTRQVKRLDKKLASITSAARESVESDLKLAMENPDIQFLQDVVTQCEARLIDTEQTQAEALRKVNLHLAQIARVVEAKLNTEREERIAHVDKTALELNGRLTQIESDTADALMRIGDKIEVLSDRFNARQAEDQDQLNEKLNELALQTQSDVEHLRAELIAKTDTDNELSPAYDKAQFDRVTTQLDRLSARLELLEREHNEVQTAASMAVPIPAAVPPAAMAPVAFETPPASTGTLNGDIAAEFTPPPPPSKVPVVSEVTAPEAEQTSTGPVEFTPQAFTLPPGQAQAAPIASYRAEGGIANDISASVTAPTETSFTPPMSEDTSLPYADPAYAETEMRAERVAASEGEKSKFSLPISGKNLRVAGLAIAVGAVGLYAGKSVLGLGGPADSGAVKVVHNSAEDSMEALPAAATQTEINSAKTLSAETVPAIGQYEDNAAPVIDEGGSVTLLSAAKAGNAIAQYQLGLSHLQEGRMDEGVDMIRLAAGKNMPAAQYRLAKIYESGQGVEADPETARKLTEQAARGGNRIAMHDLALYYTDGKGGVDKDIAEAVRWFKEAADRGVVDSQFNLAVLSESGQGLQQSFETAFFWYSIAARQGDQYAQKRVSLLKENLSPDQLSMLKQRIRDFEPKAINEAANGIFKNLPWVKPSAKPQSVEIVRVRKAQTILTELGYDIGGADGAAGPRTRAAIKAFESVNGMQETGEITPELLEKLEIAAGA